MKNTKKLLTWILVAVLVVATVALVACVDKPDVEQLNIRLPELKDNQMAVIIMNGEDYTTYVVTLGEGGTDATTAEGVLDYLVSKSGLSLTCSGSGSDKFITSIGGISPNPNATNYEYIEIFTSNTAFHATWAGATEYITADGVTLKSASKGIHELGVTAGDVIYFQVSEYIM